LQHPPSFSAQRRGRPLLSMIGVELLGVVGFHHASLSGAGG
jgi:hypothetical protein